MEHTKAVGDRTTLAVMLALEEAGYPFLIPFGENTRFDLAIDEGSRLARVQCKTRIGLRDRDDPRARYERTSRDFWCVTILRFTRWSALSIVFVSQPSSSAICS